MGAKKNPFYRLVVADQRSPRDGRLLESIGTYDPGTAAVKVDREKAIAWLNRGAQPTDTVYELLVRAGVIGRPAESAAQGQEG